MKVFVKLLNKMASSPTRGSSGAAGLDLYASEDVLIPAGTTARVKTDVAIAIPDGYVGLIRPRSGLAIKNGIDTRAGVIDSDYRGEVVVLLRNESNTVFAVAPGMRVAQLVIVPYLDADMILVDDLENTNRGENGFGSTGQ